jgi:hypothetical protein
MSEPEAGPSSRSYNRNPTGTNQHIDCRTGCPLIYQLTHVLHVYVAMLDDENVANLLKQYHHDGITDKTVIASLLGKKGYRMR